MLKIAIDFLCWANNLSYKLISSLVVRENDGVHPKHRIMNYHKFFLDNIKKTDAILDIGCGNGSVAADLADKARIVVGIDIDRKNIADAKKLHRRNNLTYITGDATSYPFNEKFDTIILSNVLEHINQRVQFLHGIKNLAPKILIRVPLITRDWLAVYKKECDLEYRLDPTHFIEYTEKDFKKELSEAGVAIENYYIKFGELYAITKPNEER
jgi:2-polyprenyl-3-methyl-5-hydroxy-6-metoxy-1,4-benzoquinol methylase